MLSVYFFCIAIYSLRNVLFASKNSVIHNDNSFLITFWIAGLIFAIPCLICSIIIWKNLKRKSIKVFLLVVTIIYEVLFLSRMLLCIRLYFRSPLFLYLMWSIILFIALIINSFVIYWISTQKTVKIKESNNICDKVISE